MDTKGHCFPKSIIIQAVYFKLRFSLSYRAADRDGHTIDFLLTKRRQRMSAQSFLIKAIENNGTTELINIEPRILSQQEEP